MAAIDADYQTHCVECFMGMPEHCTEGLAPNGQPCVTTPAQRIAWLLDGVQRVVAHRNAADIEVAALTARLAAVEAALARQTAALEAIQVATAVMSLGPAARAWQIADAALHEREEPTDGVHPERGASGL